MTTRPGRNDPCHCGSGKKYKRCHLPLDEQADMAAQPPPQLAESAEGSAHESTESLGQSEQERREFFKRWGSARAATRNPAEFLKAVAKTSFVKRDPELRRLFKEDESLFNFLGAQAEIEAATAKIKAYEEEFDKLYDDKQAFFDRCGALFSEETFTPLRFSAADVERAFQQVGFPPMGADEDEERALCQRAIEFLSPKELRSRLALELLTRLPKYVEQGRYLDGCVLDLCARQMEEETNYISPFLSCMFGFGFNAWVASQRQAEFAFLRELGLPTDKDLTPNAIDTWVKQHAEDPANAARLEEFLRRHPAWGRQAAVEPPQLHRRLITLLEREDAACLLLSPEELEPWMPLVAQKLQLLAERFGLAGRTGPLPEAQQKEAFEDVFLPLMREMAKGIFTPERIARLVLDLRAYRNRLFAAGEKKAAFCALGAIHYVEPEDDPSQNVFLLNLCSRSLHRGEQAEEAEAAED
jgi:hypothetical protein